MDTISVDIVRERLCDLGRRGADHADLYIRSGSGHRLHMEDSKVADVASFSTDGMGARIMVGDATYYSHAPGMDTMGASEALMLAEQYAGFKVPPMSGNPQPLAVPAPVLPSLDSQILIDVDNAIRTASSMVRQVSVNYNASLRNSTTMASDGRAVSDLQKYTSFSVHVVVEQDGVLRTGYEAASFTLPVENFWRKVSALDIAYEALRLALLQVSAKPCPAGAMPVLISGQAGGTLIHEACGHGLEADIVLKDYSTFRDRLGEQVASSLVTMIDDATIPGFYGSYLYDGEGTPASRTVLIENGVLKQYLTDVQTAKKGGWEATGNGRRDSYLSLPIPRMSNTYLAAGDGNEDEMLDSMEYGLYVCKMGGGEVNPTNGDFVFHVSEGYIIERGTVTCAVRGATLTGNGPDTLMDVQAVGKEVHFDPGICGKSGQGVPVTDGQPAILISSLIVGGSDTSDA